MPALMSLFMLALPAKDPGLPLQDPVYIFGVLLLILLAAPLLAKPFKLPVLIVLLVLGCLLGSNGLGVLTRGPQLIFLEKAGLLYIMLLAGMQMDLSNLRRLGLRSLFFGLLTFGLPFIIGMISAQGMLKIGLIDASTTPSTLLTVALMGILFSPHTLLAYPIMIRLGIVQREPVGVAVGGTVLTSLLTLVGLTLVQASAKGQISAELGLKLVIGLPLLIALCFWGIPKLGQQFFDPQADIPLSLQFIFVLTTLFTVASATLGLGVDSIVGAFIAGLALNQSIPLQSDLMNRIDFVGNSLFIPIFIVSVGVLANPKIFVTAPGSLGVAAIIICGAILAKFAAAWIAGQSFKYNWNETMTICSLTISRAALVLVIVTSGKDLKLVDEPVFNAVIAYIVVTCFLGPILAEWFGQRVAAQESELKPMAQG
jgi:Kef-type K+ transport system membrane component KefB